MVKIMLNLMFIIFFHILIFILFPDTGKYGDYYLYGFIAVWSFLYIYLITNTFFKKFPFKLFFKLIFFSIMIITSLIFTPQEDNKSIIKKIINFEFPSSQQIQRGKIKYLNKIFDIKTNNLINPIIEDIKRNINKLLKEMNR